MFDIIIKGVPLSWPVKRLNLILANTTKQHFEPISFSSTGSFSTAFVRVQENPSAFVKAVNRAQLKSANLHAIISKDAPLKKNKSLPKISIKTQRNLKMHVKRSENQVLSHTSAELLMELQMKYSGLYSLSRTMGNRLLMEISRIIADRLKDIVSLCPSRLDNCFTLSSGYRAKHPHFTDFEMVLSTLHRLEDEAGRPRTQLDQRELSKAPQEIIMLGNITFTKVENICQSYSDKVIKKLKEHVEKLSTDTGDSATVMEKTRARVRSEIKRTLPYMDSIMRQVFTWNFLSKAPKVPQHHKMRVYGEPKLPVKEHMQRFFRRCHAKRVRRSDVTYNMVYFIIPRQMYAVCMKTDGTSIDKCKLVVRCSEVPAFKSDGLKPFHIRQGAESLGLEM